MDKHYKQALRDAVIERLSEMDVKADEKIVERVIENSNRCITGNWQEDIHTVINEGWEDADKNDDENDDLEIYNEVPPKDIIQQKKNCETRIEEIVQSLKVGYNMVPGIGAGWCSNEEDLENLRNYIRGALTAKAMMGDFPSIQ